MSTFSCRFIHNFQCKIHVILLIFIILHKFSKVYLLIFYSQYTSQPGKTAWLSSCLSIYNIHLSTFTKHQICYNKRNIRSRKASQYGGNITYGNEWRAIYAKFAIFSSRVDVAVSYGTAQRRRATRRRLSGTLLKRAVAVGTRPFVLYFLIRFGPRRLYCRRQSPASLADRRGPYGLPVLAH